MDESTLGSLRHRVPILDGEFFHEWKNEMLVIFNQYHLNKMKEICPRGNNKVIIYFLIIMINVYYSC